MAFGIRVLVLKMLASGLKPFPDTTAINNTEPKRRVDNGEDAVVHFRRLLVAKRPG